MLLNPLKTFKDEDEMDEDNVSNEEITEVDSAARIVTLEALVKCKERLVEIKEE